MLGRPIVHTQGEAVIKELRQQLHSALSGLNAMDSVSGRVDSLGTTVAALEVKISNVSKVLRLQQDYADQQDAVIRTLQEKVKALEANEKVLADLGYRVAGMEGAGKVEARLQGLEERVSRLTLASSKDANTVREDQLLHKMQTALESFRSELDQLKASRRGSPVPGASERLQRLEQEMQTKAALSEVQRLGEVIERELKSRESSLLDSLQGTTELPAYPLTVVSKHLGTGYGSFGVSAENKENEDSGTSSATHKRKRTMPKARPHSARPCAKSARKR